MTRKLISFDWAIKKLLRSKANSAVLEGFLSELLFTDVKIVEILESETNRETATNKQNRVDIKVKDSDGQLMLIEVQYSQEQDYLYRILFETSKCIAEHLQKNAAYSDVVKVISISILYFNFCKGEDYIYKGTTEFFGMHNHVELQLNPEQKRIFGVDKVYDIYPEHYIINIRNFDDHAKDTLDEWIYFLKNEEVEDGFSAKGLHEAKKILNVLQLSDEDRVEYELYQKELHHQASLHESTYVLGKQEGKEEGREEGREEGKEEGKEAKQEEVGINLIKMGALNDEQIAQATGLTEKEVGLLRASLLNDI